VGSKHIISGNLRTLGRAIHKEHPVTIALELEGQIFAPILDVQGNIIRLISPDSNVVAQSYEFNAFGELLSDQQQQSYWSLLGYSEPTNPWRFASKRYDPELGLIYYGKRYYDPESARWLTTDPAGFIDSANLYQYLFNNPLHYFDPDGQFAFVIPFLIWGVEAAFPALSAYAAPLVYGAITGAVAYGGYKIAQAINKPEDNYSAAEDYARYVRKCELEEENEKKKKEIRTKPKNLDEQLALEEAKENEGKQIMQDKVNDPKYPKEDWKKVQHNHESLDETNIEIHYWENIKTGEKTGFKFKDYN
jgi:RHS repeat-associated protein